MNRKVLATIFCITVSATALAAPPFKVDDLKLSAEESSRMDRYYKKFKFLDVSRKRLLAEVKAASVGKYTSICGEDIPKWQAYMSDLFSTAKYDEPIYAAIEQTNAQESLIAHSGMLFRETIKSPEIRKHLDQLQANSTTQSMFFIYVANSWLRSYADPEFNEIAEKFLRGHCGLNSRAK